MSYEDTGTNADYNHWDVEIVQNGTYEGIPLFEWFIKSEFSFKLLQELEEQIEQYRIQMLNIDRRYEGTKKSIRAKHYTRSMRSRRYYHLYKHRSF